MNLTDYIKKSNEIIKQRNECSQTIKIVILRSFSCEGIVPILQVKSYEREILCEVDFGQFNQYTQETLDTGSFLYRAAPQIVVLAIQAEDLYPGLVLLLDSAEQIDRALADIKEHLRHLLRILKEKLNAAVLVHGFTVPYFSMDDLYGRQDVHGVTNTVRRMNLIMQEVIADFPGVHYLDIEHIISDIGKKNCYDLRMWEYAKNPYSFRFYEQLAELYADNIAVIYGKRKKCIVVDLDNTLWKGIVGEDGFEGIQVTDSHRRFQQMLRYIGNTGILLCVNSKNNRDDAVEVLKNHPDMILGIDDFSVLKINWQDKASNLVEIAEELNIGLESVIFIDDNPVECEMVAVKLPQVQVAQLPKSELDFPDMFKSIRGIDFQILTEEDKRKTEQYRQQQNRDRIKLESTSMEAFYKTLDMKLTIFEADEHTIQRVAQLTQKTNQFNLTTKRYSAEDLRSMLMTGYQIFCLSVEDKFGDYGLTGAAIVKIDQDDLHKEILYIDSFLLSCRVMGRTVENAFMSFLFEYAGGQGLTGIRGTFLPTAKNKPSETLYSSLGFRKESDRNWYLDILGHTIPCPDYFTLILNEPGCGKNHSSG